MKNAKIVSEYSSLVIHQIEMKLSQEIEKQREVDYESKYFGQDLCK